MARPEEKAQAMLNKWTKMREQGDDYHEKQSSKRRPFLASQCEHLHDAERWRREIIREISEGIRKIQNPGLGEHAIRDLNDGINKLMREKWHWNRRIIELSDGTVNHIREEKRLQIEEGDDQQGSLSLGLRGSGGYRYFGAAKDLPGVKDLFARNATKITRRKRGDVYKYITPDYYGLRDEEDGVLLELEEELDKSRREQLRLAREEYRKDHDADLVAANESGEDDDYYYEGGVNGFTGAAETIVAHVAVPTQDFVAQTILDRKKKELLDRLQ